MRGYFTSARFQLCASSWNAVFFGQHHDFIVHQDLRIAAGTISSPSRVMEMTTGILGDDKLSQRFPRMGEALWNEHLG